MNIEVLVSTMNLKNQEQLIKKMNIKKSVIINQTKNINLPDITEGKNRLYSYNEKGLSRSRNKAIENSIADICLIADDDVKYENNYEKIVEEGYKKYPDADIIAFYLDNVDENIYRPKRKEGKINFVKSMQIKSSQITFKRKSIIEKGIRFNERFGTGSELYMGEENIFLAQCLKKNLNIYYIPITIVVTQENNSSWFKGHNEYNFNVKGAVYYEMSKRLYPILILQFALRKRKLYSKEVKTLNAIKYMFEGVHKYKKSKNKKIYFMGDFCSDTGPAIVNKSYYPYLKDESYICRTNNKIIRVIHFLFYIKRCNVLLISCLSKFHAKAAKIAKEKNKKVIYLMHGYDKLQYELNEVPNDERILIDYEEKILKMSDKIICVSKKFCDYMKKERKDIKEKIDFVNNGVSKLNTNYQTRKDNIYRIISVGGGVKLKKNLEICKAIEKIKDFKIKYIVIGNNGKDGHKIKEYDFVEYYEHLDHSQVLKKMKEADLYIQNSDIETFGLAIIEAINQGCNILISSNVGVMSVFKQLEDVNIIYDNKNIDEIKNKIIEIYKNRDKKLEINIENKYTWKKAAEKIKEKCKEN